MAPLVDLAGVSYHYPDSGAAALAGINLALDGGFCAVAGASGGGKSTLLRLFNGLVPHLHGGRISGRATVAGHDILRTPTRRLAAAVGFVFQDAERQAVHTTVERDIAFGLENQGFPVAEMHARVGEMLERLDISHLRTRSIATLSGGERQRVAVAGALVLRPRILVLDEPLSQLDDTGAHALLDLCRELRDLGTAVVMAEHRLDDLLPVADHLVTVEGGRCLGPQPPQALAGTLDSAPQLVRLSLAMGWDPVLLDPRQAVLPMPASPIGAAPSAPASTAATAWELTDVSIRRASLDEVSLSGRAGEVLAVLGNNGCGKTSLLRVIAGLTSADDGRSWRAPGRVAYLPQNPAALLHRESVAAEVAWTAGSDPTEELLAGLGLEDVAARDPRDLSSGQRQRAAVAAVVAGSPRLVLLDEPTRGMDGRARAGLIATVRRLCATGAAVVIATHDTELAATLADRIVVIEGGRARDAGDPVHALSGPTGPATQLGRRFPSPGPVSVEAVVAMLRASATVSAAAR